MVSNKVLNPRLGEDNRCSFIIISGFVTILVNVVNSFVNLVILRNILSSVSEVNLKLVSFLAVFVGYSLRVSILTQYIVLFKT